MRVPPGVSVFDAASWNGIAIDSTCGGHGTCKKCKVRIVDGELPAISALDARAFDQAQLADGWRLACRAQAVATAGRRRPTARHAAEGLDRGRRPTGDPPAGTPEALRRARRADPLPTSAPISSGSPTRSTILSCRSSRPCSASSRASCEAPASASPASSSTTCSSTSQPGTRPSCLPAIAFDLGTTTVVATLLDLGTGTPLAVRSRLNRQQPFGADVISRISATMLDPGGAGAAARARRRDDAGAGRGGLRGGGDRADRGLRGLARRERDDDRARARYRPGAGRGRALHHGLALVSRHARAPSSGCGSIPRARATIFPALGAYVGGDIVAGLLATGMTTVTRAYGSSSTSARTARSPSARQTASSVRPHPRARPSRARRSAAACGLRTARSRW